MNIEEIKINIANVAWFSASGTYPGEDGKRPIRSLRAWDSATFGASIDPEFASIAAEMDWLPTTRDGIDPIYGDYLKEELKNKGPNAQSQVMSVYKEAMKSLRNVDSSKFISGANNFFEAAIGSALFCSRMAAAEVVIGKPGVWCELLNVYFHGYWPCGRMPDGDFVVY